MLLLRPHMQGLNKRSFCETMFLNYMVLLRHPYAGRGKFLANAQKFNDASDGVQA